VVHKTNQSPPSRAEVRNEWSYTSAAPAHIQGIYMTKFCIIQKCEKNISLVSVTLTQLKITRGLQNMNLCAQNYQLAVTQSSQQLATSNINPLKHYSYFNKLFLYHSETQFCPNNILCLTILTISNDYFPRTAFTNCLCNGVAVFFHEEAIKSHILSALKS
jgi:hypothetical protein